MEKFPRGPITQGPINDLVFLEWQARRDGYQVQEQPAVPDIGASAGPYLIPIGRSGFIYRPMEEHPSMFREFADLEPTPEAVVSFANKYGAPIGDFGHYKYTEGFPQTAEPLVTREEIYRGNYLEHIYGYIQDMQKAVERYESGDLDGLITPSSLASADLKFDRVEGRETPNLFIQPRTLKDAMWFQFARTVAGGIQIRKCSQCPAWFPFGTGTGRRKSALYCSDRCRKAAHEKRRRSRK